MTGAGRLWLNLLLLMTGAFWGLSNPLMKVAVSTGYQPLGLIFWQLLIIIVTAGAVSLAVYRRLPRMRGNLRHFATVAAIGTLLPDYLVYIAAGKLSAGVLSLVLAQVTILSLPLALVFRLERFEGRRALGAVLGAVAVVLMIGPQMSVPGGGTIPYILLTLLGASFYALQGIYVAMANRQDLDAVSLLFGASVVGFCVIAPLSVVTGQFVSPFVPWGAAEWAILGTSLSHALAYGGFFALVARGGAVYSSQVAYVVTGTGIFWSIMLLGEGYSGWIWAAFALMIGGIALLQPRPLKER
jgi:drug/metabolite transporter (DMT)-like permease